MTTLNTLLASLVDLSLLERKLHVSMTGLDFVPTHELFETFYDATTAHVDLLAERIERLGGDPALLSWEIETFTGLELSAILEHHDAFTTESGRSMLYSAKSALVDLAESLIDDETDAVTEDILIEIARTQEHHLYLLGQSTR